MALTSFADVQKFFNDFITQQGIDIAGAPHGAFWNNLTYDNFVNGNVPGVTDPNTGKPVPILTKGDGAHSNIIYALSGTPGTLWDPNNPTGFGLMPPGLSNFSSDQIQELSDWITGPPPCAP
ncbi:MAG: hypothetical protein ACJ8H8_29360 [Geminicoccaceae bacterium]|jgi:hypothetical protein